MLRETQQKVGWGGPRAPLQEPAGWRLKRLSSSSSSSSLLVKDLWEQQVALQISLWLAPSYSSHFLLREGALTT